MGLAQNQPKDIWKVGVDDRDRTCDNRNHNPGLYQLSYIHHRAIESSISTIKTGTPDRTRTCNPRLRRPVLYPVELRAPCGWFFLNAPPARDESKWSRRWDSNSRPSAPKADALTELRYASTIDRKPRLYLEGWILSTQGQQKPAKISTSHDWWSR